MDNDTVLKSKYGFTLIEKAYHPRMEDTEIILHNIIKLYKEHFCVQSIPAFSVINDPTAECPYINREHHEIHISCVYVHWSQIAYQFCHELCHYMIPREVPHALRWFEESICALASFYFMNILSDVWQEKSLLHAAEYGKKIKLYALNEFQNPDVFDLVSLSDPSSAISQAFSKKDGEYDRRKNKYIATRLLPFFLEQPVLSPIRCKNSARWRAAAYKKSIWCC